MILVGLALLGLLIAAICYPFARMIARRKWEQGEPTWWSLKLHSGDRDAALAEDRARWEARARRRERRRR